MLKLLLKAIKILLVLALLAGLGFGLYYLTLRLDWPWWLAIVLFLGLLGLILGALFLRKWLFRRKEARFVQRIVEQDESVMPAITVGERPSLVELESRWKEAIEVLRRSHLKRFGNPVYVIPWYLMLGELGSGKSMAIQSARLHAPLTEVSRVRGTTGTRNCDWWFFDRAVIVDTTGRYAIPTDEARDKEEWKKFLSLFVKSRRHEPVNGVIVTVAADRLRSAGPDALADTGRAIRRRIDELMRVFGAQFPVYVLVTKMDQVPGITELGSFLPPAALQQAMGVGNADLTTDPATIAGEAVAEVGERIKDIRLLAMHRGGPRDPNLFLLPDELGAMKSALVAFVESLFQENPYQETPLLRGIYFSSAQQAGRISPKVMPDLEAFKDRSQNLPGTSQGLFLKDLFSKILPADRDLITPLKEYISWKRWTRSLGLTAWIALVVFLCGLLSFSFLKNIQVLNEFIQDIPKLPVIIGDLQKDLLVMDTFRLELVEMEALNRGWIVPRLGLDQSRLVEEKLKTQYCRMFQKLFMNRLDTALSKMVDRQIGARTPGETVGALVEHLETRIHLLVAAINGASASDLAKLPQPSYELLHYLDARMVRTVAAKFRLLYLAYLDWSPADEQGLARELASLRDLAGEVAGNRAITLNWLADWANAQPDLKPVKLEEFWGRSRLTNPDSVQVPQAYTQTGRKKIFTFLKRYEEALNDPNLLKQRQTEFEAWYRLHYLEAWEMFGQGFEEGRVKISGETELRALAEIMADPKNPYFILLDRMAAELEPLDKLEDLPIWVQSVVTFQKVKQQAASEKVLKSAGTLTKAAEKATATIKKAVQKPAGDTLERLETISDAAGQLINYEKALTQIIPVTSSREAAFKMAGAFYPTGQEAQSPFNDAHTALTRLKATIRTPESQMDNLFWRVLSGPLYFLLAYTTNEAACELQRKWEGSVLAEVKDLPDQKLRQRLFAKDSGLVGQFVSGPAKPFLGREARGYYARDFLKFRFPFNKSFLQFLDRSDILEQRVLPEYKVQVETRPIDVNRGALLEPFAVILTLNCKDGIQKLDNYNFLSRQVFTWKPDQCGDVTLEIRFNDFTLKKNYQGIYGFPQFLEDFRAGTRVFTVEDFPNQALNLSGILVREIRVHYLLSGDEPVRVLKRTRRIPVPVEVVECFGR